MADEDLRVIDIISHDDECMFCRKPNTPTQAAFRGEAWWIVASWVHLGVERAIAEETLDTHLRASGVPPLYRGYYGTGKPRGSQKPGYEVGLVICRECADKKNIDVDRETVPTYAQKGWGLEGE